MKSIKVFAVLFFALCGSLLFASASNGKSAEDRTYSMSEVESAPVVKHQVPPVYPAELRKAHVVGEAKIQFVVDPSGQTTQVVCLSSAAPEFGDAAIQAVQQWQFQPAQKGGRAVACRIVMPIVFAL